MAVTTTVAVKDARVTAVKTTWVLPKLRIYSGTPPADVNAALSGNTIIAEVTPAPGTASSGVMDMLGASKPLVTTAIAAGTVTFYRVVHSSGSPFYEQGTVGTSGADLIIDNTVIASGQTVNFNSFTKTEP
jgi:hypothetical protein